MSTTYRIIRTDVFIVQTKYFIGIKVVDAKSENIGVVEQYTGGKALL
ncbi:hypothetical protein VCR29J2_30064 [Vibrio coralliirubri]|nr:hypothetical protein VCR29J2_30064 [Vibrio coralliirubri]